MKASFSLNGYMLIDDKKATVEQVNAIISERDNALAQNAELVAQVEALRRAYEEYQVCGFDEILEKAFDATPAQCLRDIQAEAVDKFSAWLIDSPAIINKKQLRLDIFKATNQYAASVKAGEV